MIAFVLFNHVSTTQISAMIANGDKSSLRKAVTEKMFSV